MAVHGHAAHGRSRRLVASPRVSIHRSRQDIFTRHASQPDHYRRPAVPTARTLCSIRARGLSAAKPLLLVRVEDLRGISHLIAARSRDGATDWRFDAAAPDRTRAR